MKSYVARKSMLDPALLAELCVVIIGLIVVIISEKYRTLGIVVTVLGILSFFGQFIHLRSYKAVVNDNSLIITQGILSRKEETIDLHNIASIDKFQPLLGRVFHYGDLKVDIIGKGPTLLPQIKNVNRLHKVLMEKM